MITADFQIAGKVFVDIDLLKIISKAFEIYGDDFFNIYVEVLSLPTDEAFGKEFITRWMSMAYMLLIENK